MVHRSRPRLLAKTLGLLRPCYIVIRDDRFIKRGNFPALAGAIEMLDIMLNAVMSCRPIGCQRGLHGLGEGTAVTDGNQIGSIAEAGAGAVGRGGNDLTPILHGFAEHKWECLIRRWQN